MNDDPIRMKPVLPPQSGQTPAVKKAQEKTPDTYAPSFENTLAQTLRFSNHAQKRIDSRSINLSDDGLSRLTDAVEKAQKRGGRESLVLVDDLAFIVNVQERLVVTAMDRNRSGDGVFTQIDSVVIAEKSAEKKSVPSEPETKPTQTKA